jgi:hypothetical protein
LSKTIAFYKIKDVMLDNDLSNIMTHETNSQDVNGVEVTVPETTVPPSLTTPGPKAGPPQPT